jgi:hypothetical protein
MLLNKYNLSFFVGINVETALHQELSLGFFLFYPFRHLKRYMP